MSISSISSFFIFLRTDNPLVAIKCVKLNSIRIRGPRRYNQRGAETFVINRVAMFNCVERRNISLRIGFTANKINSFTQIRSMKFHYILRYTIYKFMFLKKTNFVIRSITIFAIRYFAFLFNM